MSQKIKNHLFRETIRKEPRGLPRRADPGPGGPYPGEGSRKPHRLERRDQDGRGLARTAVLASSSEGGGRFIIQGTQGLHLNRNSRGRTSRAPGGAASPRG